MSKKIYMTVSEEEYTIAKDMDFFNIEKAIRPCFESIIRARSEQYGTNKKPQK